MKKIVLCGRPNACCPEVLYYGDDHIEIVDDYGGSVIMNKEQLEILKEKLASGVI